MLPCRLTRILGADISPESWEVANLPLSLGWLGLRSAPRVSKAAYWSSWAECVQTTAKRQPAVAEQLVAALTNREPGRHLESAVESRERLLDAGFLAPVWRDFTGDHSPRPGRCNLDDAEPGSRHGWQQVSSMTLEECFVRNYLWPRLRALFRSQGGPLASVPCTCFPIAPHCRFDPQPFRVLLLRRLWLPLPSTSRNCQCGLPLDSRGHHRAACAVAGVLGRRGFTLESAAARVCREAGARVSLDVRVKDMDLARPDALDNRRLEVVADGLPLFQGAQLAVDTTAVSVLRRDGAPRRRVVSQDGAALDAARRRKERVYPELTGQLGRTRLVVLACEVAGRWSEGSVDFLNQLAVAKARREPRHLRARARQAWRQGWATLLACSAAVGAQERVGLRRLHPTTEVISDHRHWPFPV